MKFTVTTRLSCSASTYITDKDSAVYKKFHVRCPTVPASPVHDPPLHARSRRPTKNAQV